MSEQKFVYVTYIAAPPEKVFQALTDPRFTKRYWVSKEILSDWKVGSPLFLRHPDGRQVEHGKILAVDPPRMLSYTFEPRPPQIERPERASRVLFEIDRQGETVRLTVTHDDFPADSIVFPIITRGWPVILSGLKTLLESDRELHLGMLPDQCQSD